MNTRETGSEAESFAADWLAKKGWEILDRNFCIKGGELDIIAKKGDILAFVGEKLGSRVLGRRHSA